MAAPHIEIPQPTRIDAQIVGLPPHALKELQATYPDIVVFQSLTPEQRAAKTQELWDRDTEEARLKVGQLIKNYQNPILRDKVEKNMLKAGSDTYGLAILKLAGIINWEAYYNRFLSTFEQSVPDEPPKWVKLIEKQDSLGKISHGGFGILPRNIPYFFDHYGLVTGEPMTYAEISKQPGRTGVIANKVNAVRGELLRESELREIVEANVTPIR